MSKSTKQSAFAATVRRVDSTAESTDLNLPVSYGEFRDLATACEFIREQASTFAGYGVTRITYEISYVSAEGTPSPPLFSQIGGPSSAPVILDALIASIEGPTDT